MSAAQTEGTILLVEDDESVRYLVRAMLGHHGYVPLVADSSLHAVALFEQHVSTIEILLTDVVMPDMSGVELAVKLRMLAPTLKIIYMSGYLAEDIRSADPANTKPIILQKPFTADALMSRVREALASGA